MGLKEQIDDLRQQLNRLERELGERYRGPAIPDVDRPPTQYKTIVEDSGDAGYVNKLLVATPTTGLVRVEWVMGRYGQLVPPNWSMVQMNQYLNAYIPLRYQVADAQNLIVKQAIEGNFMWLLLVEHDVVLPPDAFRRLDNWMRKDEVPVVSGLYYTRGRPSEPLIYRGRGAGFYEDWEHGDLVWADGVPTGLLLIHGDLLRAMWEESESYLIQLPDGNRKETRRVFTKPQRQWYDPQTQQFNNQTGTTDLEWCTRIMKEGFFEKSGWDEYQDLDYPFLVDTNIFARHINPDGEMFP